jgi:hypothetical protein
MPRDAVEHGAVRHRDDDGVDGVVAMVAAVLRLAGAAGEIVVGQMVVECPIAPEHLGQPAGRDPDMARTFAGLRIERR